MQKLKKVSKHPRGFAAGVFAVWGWESGCRGVFAVWRGRVAAVRFLRLGEGRAAAVGVCVGRGGVLMHFTPSQVAPGGTGLVFAC